jgi:hypothetical protein
MRRFWPLLAIPLAALAIGALAGALRRDAISSTPGQVVEDFLDRIVRDRYDRAAGLMTGGAETPERLKDWREKVAEGLGEVRSVRGETDWISGEEAEATGVLVAGKRERRLRFALEREDGRWRIARLDEFWGEDADAADAAEVAASVRVREGWRGRPRASRAAPLSRNP